MPSAKNRTKKNEKKKSRPSGKRFKSSIIAERRRKASVTKVNVEKLLFQHAPFDRAVRQKAENLNRKEGITKSAQFAKGAIKNIQYAAEEFLKCILTDAAKSAARAHNVQISGLDVIEAAENRGFSTDITCVGKKKDYLCNLSQAGVKRALLSIPGEPLMKRVKDSSGRVRYVHVVDKKTKKPRIVYQLSSDVHDVVRGAVSDYVEMVVNNALIYTQNSGRIQTFTKDVQNAIKEIKY